MDEINFLKRVYKLDEIESSDKRYPNAEGDIFQHRINNYDWPDNWIFDDSRFRLKEDAILLEFLCQVFHPLVRREDKPWKIIFNTINELLRSDGFELYEKSSISGRPVYGWRNTSKVTLEIVSSKEIRYANLKLIGEGSYALVYKFYDDFYKSNFVLKRAKVDLDEKEKERFRKEFTELKKLDSPFIIKVYSFNDEKLEYTMEYMDETLDKYISSRNGELEFSTRKRICNQFLKAFKYLHSKTLLHRDISYKNVLVREHDDGTHIFKVSDFGLVKTLDSELTSLDTNYKGAFNDPVLRTEGFSSYNMLHEMYAITLLVYFTFTGKTNTQNIKNPSLKEFVSKGLNTDMKQRFQDIDELILWFKKVKDE